MKKGLVFLLCIVMACGVLAGCDIKGELIGKWNGDSGYVIEFKENEDWIMYSPDGSIETLGEYTHGDGFVNLWIGKTGSTGLTGYIMPTGSKDTLTIIEMDYTDPIFPKTLTKIKE